MRIIKFVGWVERSRNPSIAVAANGGFVASLLNHPTTLLPWRYGLTAGSLRHSVTANDYLTTKCFHELTLAQEDKMALTLALSQREREIIEAIPSSTLALEGEGRVRVPKFRRRTRRNTKFRFKY
jgi:hypothetical protein